MMTPNTYLLNPKTIAQKQYEALRMYFIEKKSGLEVAKTFGYTYRGFTTIVANFRKTLRTTDEEMFFIARKKGRKKDKQISQANQLIINLRKKYYSIEDIKVTLDGKGIKVSEKSIYSIIKNEGFSRLPRRINSIKNNIEPPGIKAETSVPLNFEYEKFKSTSAGILCLLPYIVKYGIVEIIEQSDYPETSQINKVSSILAFIALKASNIRRYSADNLWCMDRGSGLFAGLNVLPKSAWFSSYSHRVTPDMNRKFLKKLHNMFSSINLLSDTSNLDFTSIPYWGNNDHLENNWSGKRNKSLSSMLAVLAHDPESGIIDYGDVNVVHKNQNAVVLEYLDFYGVHKDLKYLVFDSKFTNYENLSQLNKKGIKFITIRRRGKNIIQRVNEIPDSQWKKIRVEIAGNKKRTIKILDERVKLQGYDGDARQIIITGHGKIKPAILISNDFELSTENMVRKYTKRWIVEKAISEQIEFFHLNSVSSSMVIKVDFDLTMSIVTHNLFRLFARGLKRYAHFSDISIYEKFISNSAEISIENDEIVVELKKKRNLPVILETLKQFENFEYKFLEMKKLKFKGATYS